MDLRLRDMNGILAIEALHQEFPGARIIVLTSHTGDRLAHRALTSGASAYLLCLPTARKHEGLTQIYAL